MRWVYALGKRNNRIIDAIDANGGAKSKHMTIL